MQGFGAKRYDLPAPYGLKPKKHRLRLKRMEKLGRNYFTTPQRKLIGYLTLLILTGLLIFQVVPIFKPATSQAEYELEETVDQMGMDDDIQADPGTPQLSPDGSRPDKNDKQEEDIEIELGEKPQGKKNVVDLGKIRVDDEKLAQGMAHGEDDDN